MNKKHHIHFAARPLSAAILMALATPAAFAAVTATQLPGVGYVVSGSSVTSAIAGNKLTVTNTTPIIIQWGGTAPASGAEPLLP
jgi:roadblock/LC7 domain-containing protein